MKLHSLALTGILSAAILATAAGCSSAPKPSQDSLPEVKVAMVPDRDLARHGVSFNEDPLVAPIQLLSGFLGGKVEFIAFNLQLSLPQQERILIDGDIKTESGDIVARLYSLQEMRGFWEANTTSADTYRAKRLEVLDRYYAPSFDFTARRGNREYYFACVGKKPIQRPATAEVFITVGDGQPQSFYFDLTAPTKK